MDAKASEHVQEFCRIINDQLGLDFTDSKTADLEVLLYTRMKQTHCKTAPEYFDLLKNQGNNERRILAEHLTVGETYFFRHADQLQAFVDHVVPETIKAKEKRKQIRILSAGSSSGEELGTIAILLTEHFPQLADWTVNLEGIDLNRVALQKAKKGLYTEWSLRETDAYMRAKYFKKEKRDFLLSEQIRDKLNFQERNLVENDPDFWRADRFDVIFCRNVLMYFSSETMRDVVGRFTHALTPNGFFFLGPSETLRGISNEYHLCHTNNTFYYRRKSPDERVDPLLHPFTKAKEDKVFEDTWAESINSASERVSRLFKGLVERRNSSQSPEPELMKPKHNDSDLGKALGFFRQERYDDALDALRSDTGVDDATNPETLLLHAVILTNRKEFSEANRLCEKILLLDELNAGVYYLRALSFEHDGKLIAAIEQDQIAIYLDPNFAMAHLHLGLMAKRANDMETARSSFTKAESLLANEESSRILLFGGGFSREMLMKVCANEMRGKKELV